MQAKEASTMERTDDLNMYAKYTMTFKDFVDSNLEWYATNIKLSTPKMTGELQLALSSMWDFYEISGETIGEFKLMLLDTLHEYSSYYEEMITNYEKEFDYATAVIRKTDNIHIELPNKQVSPTDYDKYPSSIDKVNVNDPARFLLLKQQYLAQIRNLYREFASRFTDCFIHIF